MQSVTISVDMANAIWNYFANRPFAEVANLAVAYQQMVGPQIAALEQAADKGVAETSEPIEETEAA